jgi:hemerythrin superfamily protein
MPAVKKSPAKSARAPSRASGASASNDAIKLLTADHAAVKALFKQYDKLAKSDAGDDERQELAQAICRMLTVHSQIEEEIFYPAAREVLDEQDLIDEADIEHASAKELIAQIEASDPSDDHYDAKVKVLGEYIDHHIQEEQNEIFKAVKKAGLDSAAVGEELSTRKEELMAGSGAETAA